MRAYDKVPESVVYLIEWIYRILIVLAYMGKFGGGK